eukprot:g18132.t1
MGLTWHQVRGLFLAVGSVRRLGGSGTRGVGSASQSEAMSKNKIPDSISHLLLPRYLSCFLFSLCRWQKYSAVGRRLPGTRFIAFKVPLKK